MARPPPNPARRVASAQARWAPGSPGRKANRWRWTLNTSLAPAAASTSPAAARPSAMRASSAALSRQRTRGLPSRSTRTRPAPLSRHSTPTSDRLADRSISARWSAADRQGRATAAVPGCTGTVSKIGRVRPEALAQLGRPAGLQGALPPADRLTEHPHGGGARVQAQVMADLAAEAGAEQQGRGLDGPGGGHHRPGPDHQPVPAAGAGLAPRRPGRRRSAPGGRRPRRPAGPRPRRPPPGR